MKRSLVVAVLSLALIGSAAPASAAPADFGCPPKSPYRMSTDGWASTMLIACSNLSGKRVYYFNTSPVAVIRLVPDPGTQVLWLAGAQPNDWSSALTRRAVPGGYDRGTYRLLPKASVVGLSRKRILVSGQIELGPSGRAFMAKTLSGAAERRLVPRDKKMMKTFQTCVQNGANLFNSQNYYLADNLRNAIIGVDACYGVYSMAKAPRSATTFQQYADDAVRASEGLTPWPWADDILRAGGRVVRLIPRYL